jgi:hypothetical protein
MDPRGRLILAALCLGGAAIALSGCDSARSALGMEKQAPDEFAVVTRAPLTMPPDYGLRPPTPGADRPQEHNPRSQARAILLGNTAAGAGDAEADAVASGRFSKGEAAILGHAGALNPDPMIRQTVNRESTALVDADKSMFDALLFWQKPEPPGKVVDPAKEAQRLREDAALGKSPADGKVPEITRKERGWLEGLF